MGSRQSVRNDFNESAFNHFQETLQLNNALIAHLTEENRALRTEMAQNEEKQADFRTGLEKIYGELLKFKENMIEVTVDINKSQSEKDIERLKHDNTALYTKLKTINSDYYVDTSKLSTMKMLEAEINVEKDKLGKNLEDLKGIMDKATTKFVEEVENAQKDIETVLGVCKKRLDVIKGKGVDLENSKEMEKIKNILLQQNNGFIKDLMEQAKTVPTPPTNQLILTNTPTLNNPTNNYDIEIQKEPQKELNICEKQPDDDDLKILIFYAEESEDEDVEDKTRLILKNLTKKDLTKIKANRMGKKGNKSRAIIVTLNKPETLHDVMKSRYSLKETEFKGVKIVKFKKDHKKAASTSKSEVAKKNKAADATNPLLSDESDCEVGEEVEENEEDEENKELPHKIVLHYIPENENDYDHVVTILRALTNRPLRKVGYRRLGLKPKNHIRPIVVSFENEKYVEDCMKNRVFLKDNGFPKVKVCYYRDNLES